MEAFLLSTLAGLSTLLGYAIIYLKQDKTKLLVSSLSFASGIMISVSITDLIPSSFNYLIDNYFYLFAFLIILTSIAIGICLSLFIDKYLPSGESSIYRLGILSMLVIMFHNIPEGIATFMTSSANIKLGISLTFAIALHNIPEGISIAYPIYYATKSRKKAFLYTLIAGLSEPFGALLSYMFLGSIVDSIFMGVLLSIIAGIMIQISIYEFLPTAYKYKDKKTLIIYFFIGFLIMIISHLI